MHVVILGAGVIGVTTAYYLARDGHQVTVLERQPGVGLETSYANAGEVTVGYAAPWSGPGLPWKALKWALRGDSPISLRPRLDPAMAAWIWQWWRNCDAARYAQNKSRMVRLAAYSLDNLVALRAELGLRYDHASLGTLQLFRSPGQLVAAQKDLAILERLGVAHELLDPSACLRAEPGLASGGADIAGGLRLPGDETGDCFQFTQTLAEHARGAGVRFHFGVSVRSLAHEGGRIVAAETDSGAFSGDQFVMALGSYSAGLLRPLGMRIPVYPLKGYSITAPIVDAARAPRSTVLDESSKVAITRMGGRIRAGGVAEITGYDSALPPARRRSIEGVVQTLFAGAADLSQAEFWSGLRPVTPDGPPILGPTSYPNLHLNTGHGSFGWTMACGSGRVLADLLAGRRPGIDTDGLTIARYRGA